MQETANHKISDFAERADVPRHVAIIMDGNGRWAKSHGQERSAGHVKGVDTVRIITEAASEAGVEYLTLYAFSTENWQRPQEEVDMLMHLIITAIERETPRLIENGVKLRAIGDLGRMPAESQARLDDCIRRTSGGNGLTLILALSYSSRWEISRACAEIAKEVVSGVVSVDEITDSTISSHLSTAEYPDPDLLIRTGGDVRLSNFLLWQSAYTELFFTSTYWPDFSKEDFNRALSNYKSRERRFGLTSEQITTRP